MTAIHDAAREFVAAIADDDRDAIVHMLGHDPFTNTGAPAGTADYLAALCYVLGESILTDERALARLMTAPAKVDEVAIERRLAGEQIYLNIDETREGIRRGLAKGMPISTIAKQLHVSNDTVEHFAINRERAS